MKCKKCNAKVDEFHNSDYCEVCLENMADEANNKLEELRNGVRLAISMLDRGHDRRHTMKLLYQYLGDK